MPTTFTNNFQNIVDKLKSIFRAEFGATLPIFVGMDAPNGTQYLRLIPRRSTLSEYTATSEVREYEFEIVLTFKDVNTTEKGLEQVLRLISRIESLIMDNITMTLSGSAKAFDCRIESTELSESSDTGYTVFFDYRCQHMGNLL